jgi:hypothetical protein
MPEKSEVAQNGTAPARRPSDQALQVMDRAVGAVPVVADAVRNAVEGWSKSETREQELQTLRHEVSNLRNGDTRPAQVETFKQRFNAELEKAGERGADVRRQVTDEVVERARKARERVEPTVRRVRERI